jgi:hypothetical protein
MRRFPRLNEVHVEFGMFPSEVVELLPGTVLGAVVDDPDPLDHARVERLGHDLFTASASCNMGARATTRDVVYRLGVRESLLHEGQPAS